jgi:acyl-CoA reductase-like NAD-dependent aldehyde dehydrogenase
MVGKKPKSARTTLRRTSEELRVGEQLLDETKKRAKHAKGKLARQNAKRVAKVLDRTVKSIEDHQDILVHKLIEEPNE